MRSPLLLVTRRKISKHKSNLVTPLLNVTQRIPSVWDGDEPAQPDSRHPCSPHPCSPVSSTEAVAPSWTVISHAGLSLCTGPQLLLLPVLEQPLPLATFPFLCLELIPCSDLSSTVTSQGSPSFQGWP